MTSNANPSGFDQTGISRDDSGAASYDGLPRSLVAMMLASAEAAPDAEAIVEVGGDRLSYSRLVDRAAAVAGGLRASGVARGDRIANLLPAGLDWVVAFLATLFAGAVAVPVNTRLTEPEIAYVLADSGATFVFRPGTALPVGPSLVLDDAVQGDLAAIFYTSGTTGAPKGAMLTHRNFLSNVETSRRVLHIDRSRGAHVRNLISVPLFHVTGCNSQLLLQLAIGGTAVIMPTFDAQTFLRTIVDERITVLVTVPAIFALTLSQPDLDQFDLAGVSALAYGGAPIAPKLVETIKRAFVNARVGNGFGLSEASSLATFLPDEWALEYADSVGFPAPVVDVRLADPDARTGVGELLVRGPNVVSGYWNQPDASAETFVDGWLRSGDLATIDEHGLVFVVDRVKDMINRGGENVYSSEVEAVLAAAPGVREVAVVSVPDDVMGEKVGAVIVSANPADIDLGDLVAYLSQRLAEYKIPQYFRVQEAPLPRNAGGKVLKAVLRADTAWGPEVPRAGRFATSRSSGMTAP